MQLKIITPDRVVVEEADVDGVYAETTSGSIGVLPKHIPLVTPLKVGLLHYEKGGKKIPLTVMGGMLETDGNQVTVLSDAAEYSNEIDKARAEQARARAEAILHEKSATVDIKRAELSLARALVRLKAAGN